MIEHWLRLNKICREDRVFLDALKVSSSMKLRNWAIVGGAVRDLCWSNLVGRWVAPSDFDLIYHDDAMSERHRDVEIEELLNRETGSKWNVKNRARFAARVDRIAFENLPASMSYAPATISCIGVSLSNEDVVSSFSVYGIEDLFEMVIRITPRFSEFHSQVEFRDLVNSKGWLQKWPEARLID